jgi:hypothetical protein
MELEKQSREDGTIVLTRKEKEEVLRRMKERNEKKEDDKHIS